MHEHQACAHMRNIRHHIVSKRVWEPFAWLLQWLLTRTSQTFSSQVNSPLQRGRCNTNKNYCTQTNMQENYIWSTSLCPEDSYGNQMVCICMRCVHIRFWHIASTMRRHVVGELRRFVWDLELRIFSTRCLMIAGSCWLVIAFECTLRLPRRYIVRYAYVYAAFCLGKYRFKMVKWFLEEIGLRKGLGGSNMLCAASCICWISVCGDFDSDKTSGSHFVKLLQRLSIIETKYWSDNCAKQPVRNITKTLWLELLLHFTLVGAQNWFRGQRWLVQAKLWLVQVINRISNSYAGVFACKHELQNLVRHHLCGWCAGPLLRGFGCCAC